jgi:hypothetical protein
MCVEQQDGQRFIFQDDGTGIKFRVTDIIIPDDLIESELPGFLDDLYHEMANETFPYVFRVNSE